MWMHDSGSDICLQCKSAFSLLIRRHHCRRCGGLFCNSCSNKWLMIPEEEMITSAPSLLLSSSDHTVPNRCCSSCELFITSLVRNEQNATTEETNAESNIPNSLAIGVDPSISPAPFISNSEFDESVHVLPVNQRVPLLPPETSTVSGIQSSVINSERGLAAPAVLREVNCEEWRAGGVGAGKHKMYTVVVPHCIPSNRRFRVSLDNRIMTVVIPIDVLPQQKILVKAPSPPLLIQRALASTVMPPTKKDDVLPCPVCSYDNPSALLNCQMCGYEARTSVLEFTDDDEPKKYVIKVPMNVQPDDVFEVVLDFRLFTVICPADADGGDKISLLAPAPHVLHEQHSVTYATALNPQLGDSFKSKGLASLIENDPNNINSSRSNDIKSNDGRSNDIDSNDGSSGGLLSLDLFVQSPDQSHRSYNLSTATATATATAANAFPAVLPTRVINIADSKGCLVPCDNGEKFPMHEGVGKSVARKQSEGVDTEGIEETETSCVVQTAHDVSSCPGSSTISSSSSAVSTFSQQDTESAGGINCESNDVAQEGGRESGRDSLDLRSRGRVCRLCTFFNEYIEHSSDNSNSSNSTTQAIFCRLCKEDLRGDTPTPVAVPIPLATPSLTVISSLRDRQPSIPVSVLCQPLSPTYLRDCGGSADSLEMDRNTSQRSADISRSGNESRIDLSAAQATPYSLDALHSLPISSRFHDSAQTCSQHEAHEERHRSERIGARNSLSRISDIAIATDSSICDSRDGWDADYGENGRVEIVVAEQWVNCIYCVAENPPLALRCEVCYGPLIPSVRAEDNMMDT